MRRTLFRKSVEVHPPVRASVREVLWFDISDHSESADLQLAERRLGAWAVAPWLLLAGHLTVLLSLALDNPSHPGVKALIGVATSASTAGTTSRRVW